MQKIQMIKQAFDEEIAPFTAVAEQEMDNFRDLYERNEYHIKDIVDIVEEAASDVKYVLLLFSEKKNNYYKNLDIRCTIFSLNQFT